MNRHLTAALATAALGLSLAFVLPASGASAACNTASNISGSAFYTNSACGGNIFNMPNNLNKSYVGDEFNDAISSILVGHTHSGGVSNACLWKNQGFSGTRENWVNGSSTVAKYVNLTSDPLQDEASAASTQVSGSISATCSW